MSVLLPPPCTSGNTLKFWIHLPTDRPTSEVTRAIRYMLTTDPMLQDWMIVQGSNAHNRSSPDVRHANMHGMDTCRMTSQEQCVICVDDMRTGEDVYRLPCDHRFHQPCLALWFQNCRSCPSCRQFVDENGKPDVRR